MKSELLKIPGVGKTTVLDLHALGVYKITDLVGLNPEELYNRDRIRRGGKLDRCVLYVYRMAIFYAENNGDIDSDLRWWHFKDE